MFVKIILFKYHYCLYYITILYISGTFHSMDTSSGKLTLAALLMFIQNFGNFSNNIGIYHIFFITLYIPQIIHLNII